MTATVVVEQVADDAVPGEALADSARAFYGRVSRFLGAGWWIVPWDGVVATRANAGETTGRVSDSIHS